MHSERAVRQDQGFSFHIITPQECEGISSIISSGKTEAEGNKDMEMKEESYHQHFQCLQCVGVAIIKMPAMVT